MNGSSRVKVTVTMGIIVILVGGALYLFRREQQLQEQAAREARLGEVRRGDVVQRVTMTGAIMPKRSVLYQAPYKGYVRKIYVKVGDRVKAGDPLISITQSLGGSDAEYPMRASASGVVVQVLVSEGAYVTETGSDNVLLRVDDVSQFHVTCDVPEIDMAKLQVGQDAVISASALLGRRYEGTVQLIDLAARMQERWARGKVEYQVRVEINRADQALRPGMTAIVDVITAQVKDTLVLPHEFVQKDDEHYFVTLPSGERREVDVGLRNESVFEIKSGVREGERVKQIDFIAATRNRAARL